MFSTLADSLAIGGGGTNRGVFTATATSSAYATISFTPFALQRYPHARFFELAYSGLAITGYEANLLQNSIDAVVSASSFGLSASIRTYE